MPAKYNTISYSKLNASKDITLSELEANDRVKSQNMSYAKSNGKQFQLQTPKITFDYAGIPSHDSTYHPTFLDKCKGTRIPLVVNPIDKPNNETDEEFNLRKDKMEKFFKCLNFLRSSTFSEKFNSLKCIIPCNPLSSIVQKIALSVILFTLTLTIFPT